MLSLIGGLNKRSRYFMGREAIPQPRILANPTTLSTVPTGTNSNLAKFIFKPDTVSKHKNKLHRLRR